LYCLKSIYNAVRYPYALSMLRVSVLFQEIETPSSPFTESPSSFVSSTLTSAPSTTHSESVTLQQPSLSLSASSSTSSNQNSSFTITPSHLASSDHHHHSVFQVPQQKISVHCSSASLSRSCSLDSNISVIPL
jgi:hypothetical protein